jgi:hypothetical protein
MDKMKSAKASPCAWSVWYSLTLAARDIDEDQARQSFVEEAPASLDPQIARLTDLGTLLLAGLQSFLWLRPRRCSRRPTLERWTTTPRASNSTHSSSSVSSPAAAIRSRTRSRRAAQACPSPARDPEGAKLHQFVHEPRRHAEMPRRLPVAMALVHIRSNTFTQRHRVRLAHRGSPPTTMNHPQASMGILKLVKRDTL